MRKNNVHAFYTWYKSLEIGDPANYVLPDVNLNPKSNSDSKHNIDKVLKFMQNNSVKMQRTTSKEILEGNIKSIMRLILALAAHFRYKN